MARGPISARAVTTAQAAQALNLSKNTVLRMVKDGRLRGIWIGNSLRIPVVDLDALVGVESDLQNAHDYREALWSVRLALAALVKEIDRLLEEPRGGTEPG